MTTNNCILIGSAKGGVGKSSIASALAGAAASAGWSTVIVDLDPQGDVQTNLGYTERSDGGLSMANAVETGGVPDLLRDVRPNLSVVCGGPHLKRMTATLTSEAMAGRFWQNRIENALAPIAAEADLVVLDMPPQFGLVHMAAFSTARFIISPTQVDRASINGLAEVLTTLLEVRETTNPYLELLGVVCGPIPSQATAQARDVKATINDILGRDDLLIEPFIRSAPAAAELCRRDGLLPAELEDQIRADDARNPFWKSLRDGKKEPRRRTSAAAGLAQDYELITTEILRRFVERQETTAPEVDLRDTSATTKETSR